MLLFVAVPCSVVAYIAIGFLVLLVPGRMYKALLSDDIDGLKWETLWFLLTALGATLAKMIRAFLGELMGNFWRERITAKVHKRYACDNAYYVLQAEHPEVRRVDIQCNCTIVRCGWRQIRNGVVSSRIQ